MRAGAAILLVVASCGSRTPATVEPTPDPPAPAEASTTTFAEEDRLVPIYGAADLSRARSTERAAEASAERAITELELRGASPLELAAARADLAVRRRYIAALDACEESQRQCPPRLDDPPLAFDPAGESAPRLDVPLRFDLAAWRVVAVDVYGRACACRTVACIDATMLGIAWLESRPTREVLADDTATLSLTRARQCLYRLRGKTRR